MDRAISGDVTMSFSMSFFRHLLTFGGGFLVANGWMDAGVMEQAAGAVVTLAGLVWSYFNGKTPPAA
jgi:hypothetical protein